MLSIRVDGSTSRTDAFLNRILHGDLYSGIGVHAQRGVDALRAATPRESGVTADSWEYEIIFKDGAVTVWWTNSNVHEGFPVAIGLQYGHTTGTGGWVEGYDFINPALKAIFDDIADDIWKEVQRA